MSEYILSFQSAFMDVGKTEKWALIALTITGCCAYPKSNDRVSEIAT